MNCEKNFNKKYYKKYGYIYIIRIREFGKENTYIFKIGYTCELCVFLRLNSYPNGSEIVAYFYVSNPFELEKIILKELKTYYFSEKERIEFEKTYGNEYFEMNINKLYDIIYNLIKNNILYKNNLLEDLKNNKFKKHIMFFDEKFNKPLYNLFIKENIENNYNNRIYFFKNLINNLNDKIEYIADEITLDNTDRDNKFLNYNTYLESTLERESYYYHKYLFDSIRDTNKNNNQIKMI